VQPGLIGLVRSGRGVGGDVHLDPALLGIDRTRVGWRHVDCHSVVTRCMHALRLLRADRVVSVPDPVSVSFSAAEEAAWYARLPTMFAAAAALFTSADGGLLLVKPNYRNHWSLPGGILEHREPPHEGCRREVKEELGLDITPGPLLAVGWAGPHGARPRPVVHFVFDGGVLADDVPIQLQEDELDEFRFVQPTALDDYLPPMISTRVSAGRRAGDTGATAYLPWTEP